MTTIKLATAKKLLPKIIISNDFHGVILNFSIRQRFLGNGQNPLSKAILSNNFYNVAYSFGFMRHDFGNVPKPLHKI